MPSRKVALPLTLISSSSGRRAIDRIRCVWKEGTARRIPIAIPERRTSVADAPLHEAISMTELWPWLALVGLGMFHGVNPAMGWLFAVALGLHRGSRAVVLESLIPIAVGHALAVA